MAGERSPLEWAVLPAIKYAQLSGRAPRAEYWWFTLGFTVVGFLFDALDWAIGSEMGILGLLYTLALLVPTITVTVRRLHDINRSGWWFLVAMLPAVWIGFEAITETLDATFTDGEPSGRLMLAIAVFAVASLIFLFGMVRRGTEGPNRYGPDPYAFDGGLAEAHT
jgi:uncharacterized membrane protein YhaH (DUF805 family)